MPDEVRYNAYVRELQTYLRAIAKRDPAIPLVVPDGIFGPETTAAVKAFQFQTGLEPTGVVGIITWLAIYEAYKKVEEESAPARSISPFRDDARDLVLPDETGSAALFVQGALLKLSNIYSNLDFTVPTGRNDRVTQAAIKEIQRAAGTKRQDGTIDKETWNAIARLYDLHSEDG